MLSQLSYTPVYYPHFLWWAQVPSHTTLLAYVLLALIPRFAFAKLVGSSGLEPPTSRLSGVRSNHLSYEPIFQVRFREPQKLNNESLTTHTVSCVLT